MTPSPRSPRATANWTIRSRRSPSDFNSGQQATPSGTRRPCKQGGGRSRADADKDASRGRRRREECEKGGAGQGKRNRGDGGQAQPGGHGRKWTSPRVKSPGSACRTSWSGSTAAGPTPCSGRRNSPSTRPNRPTPPRPSRRARSRSSRSKAITRPRPASSTTSSPIPSWPATRSSPRSGRRASRTTSP